MRFFRTLTAALFISGCAGSPTTTPPAAATPAPPALVTSAPSSATVEGQTGTVEGTVTRGGSGPCFGLRGTDGVDYSLYVAGATVLDVGDRIRVEAVPMKLRISCGPGKSVQAARVERLS
jgi:hypothetical protein